ncbi:signal peptidase I [Buchnera aphidicola (Formosaphis micheliae)]|uniref:signal peptidase I n=1 Tax=Buchnera aphidicola TaxID=9 RepID=UPI0031B8239F
MSDLMTNIFVIITLITLCFWIISKKKCNHINSTIFCKRKRKFILYIASFFPILFIIFIIRSFLYEPFQVPSGSMMPTILPGDFILVEKFSYGIKDPIKHTTLINFNHPKRGDIVVFRHPKNEKIKYIKRIIGIPGDKIIYDTINKNFIIYPTYIDKIHYQEPVSITRSQFKLDNNTEQNIQQYMNHLLYNVFQEKIEKKIFKIILHSKLYDQENEYFKQTGKKIGHWIVPKNQYFMIGDNRDNSLDSRYWGFVPIKNLIGKATYIWMSIEKNDHKWISGIRLNRIGTLN